MGEDTKNRHFTCANTIQNEFIRKIISYLNPQSSGTVNNKLKTKAQKIIHM